jgi:hypothetical protein
MPVIFFLIYILCCNIARGSQYLGHYHVDRNFFQTGLNEISFNPHKIVPSV